MKLSGFLALIVAMALTGCVSRGPKVLSNGSDSDVAAEALRIARADIASGRPRVCYAGTIGVRAVGIPDKSLHLVRDLPRLPLPCGCTDPLALQAYHFAQVYNAEVLSYLKKRKTE